MSDATLDGSFLDDDGKVRDVDLENMFNELFYGVAGRHGLTECRKNSCPKYRKGRA